MRTEVASLLSHHTDCDLGSTPLQELLNHLQSMLELWSGVCCQLLKPGILASAWCIAGYAMSGQSSHCFCSVWQGQGSH